MESHFKFSYMESQSCYKVTVGPESLPGFIHVSFIIYMCVTETFVTWYMFFWNIHSYGSDTWTSTLPYLTISEAGNFAHLLCRELCTQGSDGHQRCSRCKRNSWLSNPIMSPTGEGLEFSVAFPQCKYAVGCRQSLHVRSVFLSSPCFFSASHTNSRIINN